LATDNADSSTTRGKPRSKAPGMAALGNVVLTGATAIAVLLSVGATALVWWFSDAWWPATIVAYVPRWPWLFPTLLLIPLALATRRWGLAGVLAFATLWVALFVMGFNIPWSRLTVLGRADPTIRVTTLNAAGDVAPATLRRFVEESQTDVLVVCECSTNIEEESKRFPGFEVRRSHGVCVLSRFPIREFRVRDPRDVWELAGSGDISLARIEGPDGPFSLLLLHLETVREGLEELVRFRSPRGLRSVTRLRRYESRLAREFAQGEPGPLLVAGDFNMPVDSQIYREFWSGFDNAFSSCGWGYGRTKWTRWYGMRIDHVLMDQSWACVAAEVGPDVGSDHRPLIADLALRR
jgi:vancomycin resistance protein VanJ